MTVTLVAPCALCGCHTNTAITALAPTGLVTICRICAKAVARATADQLAVTFMPESAVAATSAEPVCWKCYAGECAAHRLKGA